MFYIYQRTRANWAGSSYFTGHTSFYISYLFCQRPFPFHKLSSANSSSANFHLWICRGFSAFSFQAAGTLPSSKSSLIWSNPPLGAFSIIFGKEPDLRSFRFQNPSHLTENCLFGKTSCSFNCRFNFKCFQIVPKVRLKTDPCFAWGGRQSLLLKTLAVLASGFIPPGIHRVFSGFSLRFRKLFEKAFELFVLLFLTLWLYYSPGEWESLLTEWIDICLKIMHFCCWKVPGKSGILKVTRAVCPAPFFCQKKGLLQNRLNKKMR